MKLRFLNCFLLFILILQTRKVFSESFQAVYNLQTNKNIYPSQSKELENIPQNSKVLNSKGTGKQKTSFKDYFESYFSPWSSNIIFDKSNIEKKLRLNSNSLYSESYQLYSSQTFDSIERNANLLQIGKIKSKAIVLANTYLRILPTNSFLLRSPNAEGEGYPFDYAQDDFLRIGDPVLISHYTQDGSFAFVATSSGAQGFVLSKDIGDVDDIFIKRFKKKLVMINSDFYAILDKNKTKGPSIKLLMGSVLPLNDKKNILIPIRDRNNRVVFLELSLDNIGYISKPLAFTKDNVSFVLENLINKPYGWGGNLFHRDCARLVRDYFSLFAIHLPLLSSEQALMGDVYDLSSKSVFDKKHDIVRFAIPYESIVSMKGHVAVYLGLFNGEPILLHALWGLRLFDEREASYRYIIGKSIISSLDLGKKLQGFSDKNSSLAKKVISFSNLSN